MRIGSLAEWETTPQGKLDGIACVHRRRKSYCRTRYNSYSPRMPELTAMTVSAAPPMTRPMPTLALLASLFYLAISAERGRPHRPSRPR